MKKNQLLLIIKLLVIVAAFALIFHKADIEQILHYIKSVNPWALVAGYLFLLVAQIASAYRMKYYFQSAGLQLTDKFSIGLYFTGMFLNTILPGGIGGDGYKIYLIGKLKSFSKMKALRLLLSDRASGLLILMLLALLSAFFVDFNGISKYAVVFITFGIAVLFVGYFVSIRLILQESAIVAIGAVPYSVVVQLANVAIILFVLTGLGLDVFNLADSSAYILIFLVSSVLAVLPISIGGVGIRELSFMYGASLLGLNAELGIAIAIIFFVITFVCSLNGLFFWHKVEKWG